MSLINQTFKIGKKNMVVGDGNEDFDISSINGFQVKINGVVPSGGGGSQLPINGTGDIDITGNITANDDGSNTKGKITTVEADIGARGLTSTGDIDTTGTGDIISGRNFYFDGTDVYKRTINQGIPTDTPYYRAKNLAVKQEANEFSGENHFIDIQYFGTSDGQPTPNYTDNITLNNVSGNITSVGTINSENANINTTITTGVLNCDNGGTNEIKARVHNWRTSGVAGWIMEQDLATGTFPNTLQMKAGQPNGDINILSSDFNGSNGPNIIINPDTNTNGGYIKAQAFYTGTGGNSFYLKQNRVGANSADSLQIKAPSSTSTVNFKDDSNADIITIKKTSVELSTNIPLNYGLYSTRPIQYKLTRTLTIAATADTSTFTNMAFNCQSDTWTRVNDNTSVSMYNSLLEGYYKCTISQTAASSANNFDFCDIIFDYVLRLSIQTSPDIDISEPAFNYRKKPTNQARPTIEIDHLNTPVQSQPVFVLYPNQSAGETMPIEVRLTKLDF